MQISVHAHWYTCKQAHTNGFSYRCWLMIADDSSKICICTDETQFRTLAGCILRYGPFRQASKPVLGNGHFSGTAILQTLKPESSCLKADIETWPWWTALGGWWKHIIAWSLTRHCGVFHWISWKKDLKWCFNAKRPWDFIENHWLFH